MKDYKNVGAIIGAFGCMALLFISMQIARGEDKPAESDNKTQVAATTAADDTVVTTTTVSTGENEPGVVSGETGSDVSSTSGSDETVTETSVITIEGGESAEATSVTTTDIYAFIGPLTREMGALTTTAATEPYSNMDALRAKYPEKISIVGDSIARGFYAYEVLDNPYNFAAGNMATWSINDFTFDYGDKTAMVYSDALSESQPPYIYISMGMNDVNMVTADQFTEAYTEIITNVQKACPDSNIIVAGITPIGATSNFSSNDTIQRYNDELKAVAEGFGSDRIKFYDTMSIVMDPATGALRTDCDGGDGIHLSAMAYMTLLENVYPVMDQMPLPAALRAELDAGAGSETVTETVTEAQSGDASEV